MACIKSLTLNPTPPSGFIPMDDAVYVAATDKIYGVSGSYVIQFNATTGARENIAKVASPIFGPSKICYHSPTGLLYVTCWLDMSFVDESTFNPSPRSDIFPVNTATLVAGPAMGLLALFPGFTGPTHNGFNGPMAILSDSTQYLYLAWRLQDGGGQFARVDPSNTVNRNTSTFFHWSDWANWNISQFDIGSVSGTPSVIFPVPSNRITYGAQTFAGGGTKLDLLTTPETPIALLYDGLVAWAICGNGVLIGANVALGAYTSGDPTDIPNYDASFNLETAATPSPIPTPLRPFRLRFRQIGPIQYLYIAVPNQDLIVIRNQATGALEWKGGFDSPIDVVVTPTKAFAVQQGLVSLKEIT